MSSNIISFGKYKGETIEHVATQDPNYIEWLMKQSWFQQKDEAKIVINNYNIEVKETPEHNEMQAKFLDENFRLKFASLATGFNLEKLNALTAEGRKNAVEYARNFDSETIIPDRNRLEWNIRNKLYRTSIFEKEQKNVDEDVELEIEKIKLDVKQRIDDFLNGNMIEKYNQFDWRRSVTSPVFEDCTDVTFSYSFNWPRGMKIDRDRDIELNVLIDGEYNSFAIECKPSVSDDYPAVLRQMLAQRRRVQGHQILLLGKYHGVGANVDQLKKIFKCSNITVLFLADVENERI